VPKYDAFGREIGEDTLSGLGSGASAGPIPEVEPAPARTEGSPLRDDAEPLAPPPPQPQAFTAAPAQPPPPTFTAAPQQPQPQRPYVSIPMRPPRRRRSRRGLGFVILFVLFIFVAPLVCGAVAVFNTVDNATEAVRGGIKQGIRAIPTATVPAAAPTGVTGRSLVRRDHFAAALGKLRGSELRLTHLRLAPERIDVQLLTRGGRLRSVQVQPGGSVNQLGPDSGPGFDGSSTIPFSRLDPRAPQRLARQGAAKLHVPVSTLQYLVPSLFSGKVTWAAYFKRGRYVLGNAAGRYQRSYP
jgi:hypothetical protein